MRFGDLVMVIIACGTLLCLGVGGVVSSAHNFKMACIEAGKDFRSGDCVSSGAGEAE